MAPSRRSDGNSESQNPKIDILLFNMFGIDRIESIQMDRCSFADSGCMGDGTAKSFRDELSSREYRLSGLCQACQDDAFDTDAVAEVLDLIKDVPNKPDHEGRIILGKCANCAELIYEGEGNPPVHDRCSAEFRASLLES